MFYEWRRATMILQLHHLPIRTTEIARRPQSTTPEISSRRIFSVKPVYPHPAILAYLSIAITTTAIGDS